MFKYFDRKQPLRPTKCYFHAVSPALFLSTFKTLNMNRFEFAAGVLLDGETVVIKHESVKIYDGHEKVSAETILKVVNSNFYFRLYLRTAKWC